MSVHSVFLDIDGTLISGDNNGPFNDDIAGIEKAWKKGIFFLFFGNYCIKSRKKELFKKRGWFFRFDIDNGIHYCLYNFAKNATRLVTPNFWKMLET